METASCSKEGKRPVREQKEAGPWASSGGAEGGAERAERGARVRREERRRRRCLLAAQAEGGARGGRQWLVAGIESDEAEEAAVA